jgi:cobalamin biosynthesis Mg chelatase CobN
VSTHDLDAEPDLGTTLQRVLARFAGRSLDDALVAEITRALNEELASLLDGRRIQLLRDESGIRVDVLPPGANGTALDQSTSPSLVAYEAVAAALAAA